MNHKKIGLLFIILLMQSLTVAQEVIYYCSNPIGTFQAYKKNLNTNSIDTLSNDLNYNYWWVEPSPDNSKLLMMRSPVGIGVNNMFDYDSCQMVMSDISGMNKTVIVDYNQNAWTAFGNPHWHPNGNRILMLAQPTSEFFVFTIDTNGNNPQQITNQYSLDPNWSPDGNKITFIGLNNTPTFPASFDDFEVFIANYEYQSNTTSNIIQLTNDTLRDHDPCFSPDGSVIAFSSGSADLFRANIVTIDTNGGNRVELVNDNTTNGGPLNWGENNKIYYHNVNLLVTPFTAKEYSFTSSINTDLFPTITYGYISPYYASVISTSIKEPQKNLLELLVYPNPVNKVNSLTLEFKKQYNIGVINISSMNGKVLIHKEFYDRITTVDITSLNSGPYILKVFIDNQIINEKIIKN